ncbi:MAG: ABC transporter ATP-binding protein [Lachnospiraceae bacterium]
MVKENSRDIPILKVENLKKYYPVAGGIIPRTIDSIKAVDGVSFEMYKGETLGLVGESGCGKSTIGKQIVGLEKSTAGSIVYKDQCMEHTTTKIQMVFQDTYSSLNPRKHIYEILAKPMLHHKIATKENVQNQINELLDMVGLPQHILERYPHEFSGGQRQRICIAKALSLKPEFIVCDEPVSALDVSVQAQILNLFLDLQKELDLTCLFIGHGLGAVHYVSDRIAVMYLGRIVEIADADELFKHPVHPYTKALLSAAPVADPNYREQQKILLQGEISEGAKQIGCGFYGRCPHGVQSCIKKISVLESIKGRYNHFVACSLLVNA